MRFYGLLVLVFLAVGCRATSQVDGTHERYVDTWNGRLNTYREQFVELSDRIREGDVRVGDEMAEASTRGVQWTAFATDFVDLGLQIREAFKIAGRGEMLTEFIEHIKSRPTPGLTEVWFQEEGRKLQDAAKSVQTVTDQFYLESQEINLAPQWILDLETVARAQGSLEGTADELNALWEQARSYYGDLNRAARTDQYAQQLSQQRAMAFFAMASYMQQLNYQQQMINQLSRPRTCHQMGAFVTCY